MIGTALRRLVVESPRSLGAAARHRRWQEFHRLFPAISTMDVIDLGGTVQSWRRAPVRPRSVTVLNLTEPGASDEAWLRPVVGDACTARADLLRHGLPVDYDLVFSNSLIEHVGGHARRGELSREVRALAPRHWVQTPYRYFPVEPHWLFPAMQFLPVAARSRVARWWPLAHSRPTTLAAARDSVLWTELIGRAEMRSYFPESTIAGERVAGLTKSLIAVRATATSR